MGLKLDLAALCSGTRRETKRKSAFPTIAVSILFTLWTFICIYGTYYNTIEHAHVVGMQGNYEIQYDNTGDVFVYEGK